MTHGLWRQLLLQPAGLSYLLRPAPASVPAVSALAFQRVKFARTKTLRYWSMENRPIKNSASGNNIIARIRADSGLIKRARSAVFFLPCTLLSIQFQQSRPLLPVTRPVRKFQACRRHFLIAPPALCQIRHRPYIYSRYRTASQFYQSYYHGHEIFAGCV